MAHAVYICNAVGSGTALDPYRPDVPDGTQFTCLMIHEAKAKAVVVTAADALPAKAGRTRLFNGATIDDLRAKALATSPTGAMRPTVNAWLANNGYETVPVAAVSWAEVVEFVVGQVNPGATIDAAYV